jgi:TatA/E family protein of Tat protein translocase
LLRWRVRIMMKPMNLGMPEMIFIFLLALIIFGPRKLPELGRQLGKALAEFKRASNEFRSQLETEMRNIELEERAKQPAKPEPESGTLLPPPTPWQSKVLPPEEIVSRGASDAVSDPQPEPSEPALAPAPPSSSSASGK